jgi:DnaK suppressor protein
MTLTASPALTQELVLQLRRREQELQELLRAANDVAIAADAPGEVLDFKDVAAEDTRAKVDEVAQAHAIGELDRIAAALRRVDLGTYGLCDDCGEPIDERRLRALPATPFCTACQELRERPALQRR